MEALRAVFEGIELWVGLAAGLVACTVCKLAGSRRNGLALGAAIAAGSAAIGLGTTWAAALLLLAAATCMLGSAVDPMVVSVSVFASAAVYVCVPDTERALIVGGAMAAVGVGSLILRWPWNSAGVVASLAFVWIAVTDGASRTSAVAGTIGIALIHQILQISVPRARARLALTSVGVAAMAVASRVAGIQAATGIPIIEVAMSVGATAVAAWLAVRPISGPAEQAGRTSGEPPM